MPHLVAASPRRLHRTTKRTTASKVEEIGRRSPKDMRAIDTVADMVLARLDDNDAKKRPH